MIGVRKNQALRPTSTSTLVSRKKTFRADRKKPNPIRNTASVMISNGSQTKWLFRHAVVHDDESTGPLTGGRNTIMKNRSAGSDKRKFIPFERTTETGSISRGK